MARKNTPTKTEDTAANATPQGLGEASEAKTREKTTTELTNGTKREDY